MAGANPGVVEVVDLKLAWKENKCHACHPIYSVFRAVFSVLEKQNHLYLRD
jgi:hypothetical protein